MKVAKILNNYNSESPGVRANLYRILTHGRLGSSGKLLILPVDQGFEHGPVRSFAKNPDAYDPSYHYKLAIDASLSAYAAPLGFLEASAGVFAGQIPTILKLNSSNSMIPIDAEPDQAFTSSVYDALRLGCSAIGITIYPGSRRSLEMQEEAAKAIAQAKSLGLASVLWCYPRGSGMSKDGETAVDVIAYAAHVACLMGAHIVKVKLPTEHIYQTEAKKIYEAERISISTLSSRVKHVVESCFQGKRLVVFSGGPMKDEDSILQDATAIYDGGGSGLIMGRNAFQRSRNEALGLINKVTEILLR